MNNTHPDKKRLSTWTIIAPIVVVLISVPITILVAQKLSTNGDSASQKTDSAKEEVKSIADEYEGLSEEAAIEKARNAGKPARVVMRDGQAQIVTKDLRPGRLNFTIEDDKVVRVEEEAPDIKNSIDD